MAGASGLCLAHDPDRSAQYAEARRRGGRNSSSAARLRGLVPPRLATVYDRLETALAQVHEGDLDPKIASAMGSLARALVAVLTSGELEQRVRDLEATKGGPP